MDSTAGFSTWHTSGAARILKRRRTDQFNETHGGAEIDLAQSVTRLNRCLETSATCLDCCLSQEILDSGNGVLTT
jgi:hypothetical protein